MSFVRFVCVMVSVSVLAVVFQNYYQNEIDQVIANPRFLKTVSLVRHWLIKTLNFIHTILYKGYGHLLTGWKYMKEFANDLMHEIIYHGKEWKTILGRYFGGLYKLLLNALKKIAAKYRYYSVNRNDDGSNNDKTDKYDGDDKLHNENRYHKSNDDKSFKMKESHHEKNNEKMHDNTDQQSDNEKMDHNTDQQSDKNSKMQPEKDIKNDIKKQEKKSKTNQEIVFTPLELSKYDGKQGSKGLYLAFMGHVFDVKKGKEHYGPGGGYEFFAGIDASRAFVSGEFDGEGLTDDVEDLQYQDYLGLKDWMQFYHKDYIYVGKVSGRYYTVSGEATEYKHRIDELMRQAQEEQNKHDVDKIKFPPCNSEWSQAKGSTFWCTNKSGGVARDWVGVPRQYFSAGRKRCACVRETGAASDAESPDMLSGDVDDPHIREYEGCDPKATSCVAGNV